MSCSILKFKNCEIVGTTFEGRHLTINGGRITTAKAVVKSGLGQFVSEVVGEISDTGVVFSFVALEHLVIGKYIIEYWVEIQDIGREVIAVEEMMVVSANDHACQCNATTDATINLVFQKQELVVNLTKNIIQNNTPSTAPAPTPSPSIFIRHAIPFYKKMGGDYSILMLMIAIESKVPFEISNIKPISINEGKRSVIEGFEDIYPMNNNVTDYKTNKTISFYATSEKKDFQDAVFGSTGVEVTFMVEGVEHTIFGYFSPTDGFFEEQFSRSFMMDVD